MNDRATHGSFRAAWGRPLVVAGAVLALGAAGVGIGLAFATRPPHSGSSGPAAQTPPSSAVDVEPADGLMLTCGGMASFPATGLSGQGVPGLNLEPVAAALDKLAVDAPMDAPLRGVAAADAEWFVLSDDRQARTLAVAVGRWGPTGPLPADGDLPEGMVVGLADEGAGWQVTGWGHCTLAPALPVGTGFAAITALRADPTSTTVGMDVMEIDCTSARDPEPWLHEPQVIENDSEVIVIWTTTLPDAANCPSNPSVSKTIKLSAPLGDRTVLDGSVWPPAPTPRG